ncbi:hypothetical protein CHS0354_018366 [Potamilus streckersoni]|uniref:3-phosphoshikimate 1-carboxyvinyltransferase n=1 Tax=Potamilus streckersoni TaxID=2493646 RepID=A0AAE0TAG3_9BIVA|nr:hypothetical protein CHS0354_018366 [Potamilus streckersoni]
MNRDTYTDIPVKANLSGEAEIPGSKSITNRALIISALATGKSVLRNALESIDTQVARTCLEQLGIGISLNGTDYTITGNGGKFKPCNDILYVENAGTMARFLIPLLLAGQGEYTLDGNARMRQRPLKDLLESLRAGGCKLTDINGTGCLPLKITAGGFPGGRMEISGRNSSQYISALMMGAPLAQRDLEIIIQDGLVSHTYVEMTAQVMAAFGADVDMSQAGRIFIPKKRRFSPREYVIEADASSASYFFAAAAITRGRVKVKNIFRNSLQGDLKMLDVLEQMGCEVVYGADGITVQGGSLRAVDVNMNTMSDVAPTVAAVALFAEGQTRIWDAENMRIKECDRISAVCTEFRKTGAQIEELRDGFVITGNSAKTGAVFETYDDHRMAMALSLIGLRIPGVRVLDPGCTAKTFPDYFDVLFRLIASSP